MEQLKADVMVGPLSGDEAVAIANYAKAHPKKTFIIGTAGSQDPTMQIAPKNMFRYHGDGAQWNAGIGEIAYKKLGWRNAAIIMDDYSFGWTSAAGMIADFCAVGGKITKRVFPPLNNADYAAFVRQLPRPDEVDGYFWVIGGNTPGSLTAFEQAYGKPDPKQFIGNLFFAFLGNDKVVAPKFVGSYVGGFGHRSGLKTSRRRGTRRSCEVATRSCPRGRSSSTTTTTPRGRSCRVCTKSGGAVGAKLQACAAANAQAGVRGDATAESSSSTRAARRSRISTSSSSSRTPTARSVRKAVAYVPNVDQSFGGLFKPSSPPPGRSQPACKKLKTPWQGKIKVVKNGVVTNADDQVGR